VLYVGLHQVLELQCNELVKVQWFYQEIWEHKNATMISNSNPLAVHDISYDRTGFYFCYGLSRFGRYHIDMIMAHVEVVVYGKH